MTLLNASFAEEQRHINSAISAAIDNLPPAVIPPARYVLEHGGKRLRPLLVVFTARLFGYTATDIYPLAAAMEFFHVATLLHDDVMDNAELRRGQTATHKKFGVTEAILTGDALLAEGNRLIATYGDPRLTAAASDAISRTTAGEILEIANQGKYSPDLNTYLDIIEGKTAWMIRTSCFIGACRAGATDAELPLAADYGRNLGMAFQVVDDILDFSPSEQTGKPEGGDIREGKLTPPIFYYLADLAAHQPEKLEAFLAAFASQNFTGQMVSETVTAVRSSGCTESWKLADSCLQQAQKALIAMTSGNRTDSRYRDILAALIVQVKTRKH